MANVRRRDRWGRPMNDELRDRADRLEDATGEDERLVVRCTRDVRTETPPLADGGRVAIRWRLDPATKKYVLDEISRSG